MSHGNSEDGELPRLQRPNPFEVERELTPELIAAQEAAASALKALNGRRIYCLTMLLEPFVGRFVPPKDGS